LFISVQSDKILKGDIMAKFRFEDLEIWHLAIEIADRLFDIADNLERKRLYRFAVQLRGAWSNKALIQNLEYARNSTFENANILILIYRRRLVSESAREEILKELDKRCRKIMNFQNSLNAKCFCALRLA